MSSNPFATQPSQGFVMGNPTTQPPPAQFSQPKSSKLEENKKKILGKRRIQDCFEEWKQELENQTKSYEHLAKENVKSTKLHTDIREDLIMLTKATNDILQKHEQMNDDLEIILSEQNELSKAVQNFEGELDKVLVPIESTYRRNFEKNEIYEKTANLQAQIMNIENSLEEVSVGFTGESDSVSDMTADNLFETLNALERSVNQINFKMHQLESSFMY